MNWMIRIYHKYRLEIRYLFFGVLTTIVNYASFAAALWLLGTSATLVANAVSFVLATAFAYVTNKRFVFRSPGWRPSVTALRYSLRRLFLPQKRQPDRTVGLDCSGHRPS